MAWYSSSLIIGRASGVSGKWAALTFTRFKGTKVTRPGIPSLLNASIILVAVASVSTTTWKRLVERGGIVIIAQYYGYE